jgi:hypothetical protein
MCRAILINGITAPLWAGWGAGNLSHPAGRARQVVREPMPRLQSAKQE